MENATAFKDWLARQGRTMRSVARELGVSQTTAARYATGEMACDADMVARIVALTGGDVSAADMHETRLAWLKTNKPERFAKGDDLAEAAE